MSEIKYFRENDFEGISRKACLYFIEKANNFIKKKGKVTVVFPTGSSPEKMYELLSSEYKEHSF